MKQFKRFLAPVLICAVIMGATAFYFFYFEKKSDNPDRFVQDKKGLLRLISNSSEIQRLWTQGEDSREWSLIKSACLKHLGIKADFDERLLRCNPILIECHALFSKKLNYKILPDDRYEDLHYRYLSKSNTALIGLRESGISLKIEDNETKQTLDVFLADQCHEVYLEQRAYAYGEQVDIKDAEDYRFDNFNRHIYLDVHLVTNNEVNQWIRFGNPDFTRGLDEQHGNETFLPATDLNFQQMKNYCSFKGKQIMLAHFFDAATFLPMDLAETIPNKNLRSPYYWTKKKSEFKADCSLFYSKECLAKKTFQLNSISPTWAGLQDSMGGVFEVFRNPIDPESNLKASSFYYEAKSSWHKLGFRAGWDGEGFDFRNFDFRSINPFVATDKFQVGFRCMREVLQ
jgi:hypothetical protein